MQFVPFVVYVVLEFTPIQSKHLALATLKLDHFSAKGESSNAKSSTFVTDAGK